MATSTIALKFASSGLNDQESVGGSGGEMVDES
jgi:hypothetical protein